MAAQPRRGLNVLVDPAALTVLRRWAEGVAAQATALEEATGISYDEIVDCTDDMPAEYGETSAHEIVAAAKMGYRGWDAVHVAASWHRPSLPLADA
jgi:hypothetical protein